MLPSPVTVDPIDSRIPGFYRLTLNERQDLIADRLQTPVDALRRLLDTGGLTSDIANNTVENVIGTYALPFGLALNFRVNDVDRIIRVDWDKVRPADLVRAEPPLQLHECPGVILFHRPEHYISGLVASSA